MFSSVDDLSSRGPTCRPVASLCAHAGTMTLERQTVDRTQVLWTIDSATIMIEPKAGEDFPCG